MNILVNTAAVLTALAFWHLLTVRMPEEAAPAPSDAHGGFDLAGSWRAVTTVAGLFAVQRWGAPFALGSTGFMVGGAVIGRVGLGGNPLRTMLVLVLVLVLGLLGALFTIREWGWLRIAGIWLHTVLFPAVEAAEQTVIQRVVPLARQGRVFGFAMAFESSAAPVTAFVVAPLAEFWIGPRGSGMGCRRRALELAALISGGEGCSDGKAYVLLGVMNVGPLPIAPGAEDFRALARSSPWRFTTLHFTHRRQRLGGSAPDGKPVEAWLDRSVGRVSVRTSQGLVVNDGVPYSTSSVLMVESGTEPPHAPEPTAGLVLRPDGLVAQRPEGWHIEHGDPMWQDYLWTAMLDPLELSYGVGIDDVEAATVRGRPAWAATCRPLVGKGEEWEGGYDPRCGCCPLLDSAVSRLVEYGPQGPTLSDSELPTAYRVHVDVQTGIVVDITPLDGTGGTSLTNEIHAVDERLEVGP